MRIAILQLDLFLLGPFGKRATALASEWKALGHHVEIVTIYKHDKSCLPAGVRSTYFLDSPIMLLGLYLPGYLLAIPQLVKYLRSDRCDAMIAETTPIALAAIMSKLISRSKVVLVASEHIKMSMNIRLRTSRFVKLYPRFVKLLYRYADRTVAVSQDVADDLARTCGLARGPIRVVYNPVLIGNENELSLMPVDHTWFDQDVPVALAVGRLSASKDYPTLIRALKIVNATMPCRLIILGDGELRSALFDFVLECDMRDKVSFLGRQPNPLRFMRRASLLVLSSNSEGLPYVLIEALTVGCPVVATDCGGTAEILLGGELGPLVSVGDAKQLATAIVWRLKNAADRKRLIERASDFCVGKVAQEYLALLSTN